MAHDDDNHQATEAVVLEVGGLNWASEAHVIESVLGHRPGVVNVDANPVAQTATVTYDPSRTSTRELRDWIRDCGYHCRGESVPSHICDPLISTAGVQRSSGPSLAGHDHGDGHAVGRPANRSAMRGTRATRRGPSVRPTR